jgi:hypothetical protein
MLEQIHGLGTARPAQAADRRDDASIPHQLIV